MAQRGGKRPGAGRKKGVPNRVTQKQREAARQSGLTPLEYLLAVMRDDEVPRAERVDAANKAAPYVHARLASVDHKSSDGTMTPRPDRIVIEAASDDSEGKATA